ncbi:uncharacterized protein LOC142341765 isoform X2 [Convolutriloba macropyga]|uniref:uncharacterized protein LOC142341765 isoform X2 n=1 Tax=Convolutriloba macropyga TaxID=536237 RepID=UPI003F52889E
MPKQPTSFYDTWHPPKKHEKCRTYPFHNSKDDLNVTSITEFQPEDVAKQITLRDAEAFRLLTSEDLYAYAKNKKGCAGVKACSNRFNQTMFWARAEILSSNDCKRRGYLLTFFIKVAKHLCALSNFQGFAAVVTALSSSTINRLKKSWEHVEKKDRAKFDKFVQWISPESNYSNLRNLLPPTSGPGSEQPVVPFFGMFLLEFDYLQSVDQLTSNDQQNGRLAIEDHTKPGANASHDSDKVVVSSRLSSSEASKANGSSAHQVPTSGDEKMCNIVNTLMKYHQHLNYAFDSNPQIMRSINSNTCLEELVKICEADQYKRSLELEPITTSSPSGKPSSSASSVAANACNLLPPRPQTPNSHSLLSSSSNATFCSMHPPPSCTNSAHAGTGRKNSSGPTVSYQLGSSNLKAGLPPPHAGRGHRKSKSVGGSQSVAYSISTATNILDDPQSSRLPPPGPEFISKLEPPETPPYGGSTSQHPPPHPQSQANGVNKLTSSVVKTLSPLFTSPAVSSGNASSGKFNHRREKSHSFSEEWLLLSSTDFNDNDVTTSSSSRKEHDNDDDDDEDRDLEDSRSDVLFGSINGLRKAAVVSTRSTDGINYNSTYFPALRSPHLLEQRLREQCGLLPTSDNQQANVVKYSGSLKKKLVQNKGKRSRISYWKKCWVSLNENGTLAFFPHKTLHVPGKGSGGFDGSGHYHKMPSKTIDLSVDGWYVKKHGTRNFVLHSELLGKMYRFDAGDHMEKWASHIDSCMDLIKLNDSTTDDDPMLVPGTALTDNSQTNDSTSLNHENDLASCSNECINGVITTGSNNNDVKTTSNCNSEFGRQNGSTVLSATDICLLKG